MAKKQTVKKGKPKCDCCRDGLQARLDWQAKMMKKHGWFVHFVTDAGEMGNTHTHGLPESFKHLDLQIVIPTDPELLHAILAVLVEKIRSGHVFRAGVQEVGMLRKKMPLNFMAARECDRDVLRVILPDPNGKVVPDKMEPAWARQWTVS